jgi:hypothetical protein
MKEMAERFRLKKFLKTIPLKLSASSFIAAACEDFDISGVNQ